MSPDSSYGDFCSILWQARGQSKPGNYQLFKNSSNTPGSHFLHLNLAISAQQAHREPKELPAAPCCHQVPPMMPKCPLATASFRTISSSLGGTKWWKCQPWAGQGGGGGTKVILRS